MKKALLFLSVIFFSLTASIFSIDPDYYIKKSNWFETMLASQEMLHRLQEVWKRNNQIKVSELYDAGPFIAGEGKSFETVFEPEKEFDLDKTYNDGKIKWIAKPEWKNGTVNYFERINNAVHYLYKKITVPRDTVIKVYLGSDDGIKVWLNNKKVLEHDDNRGANPNQEIVELHLKAGDNNFLMRVNNNNGPTAFYFSLVESDPKDIIWSLIDRDFKTSEIIQEFNWEKKDNIWKDDWTPGDYKLIAKRYADAIANDYQSENYKMIKMIDRIKKVNDLWKIRDIYKKIRKDEYVVLTPKPGKEPKINCAKVFGVRPNAPFLFTIAASGNRPMEFSAEGLPNGLKLDEKTGQMTGTLKDKGEYTVKLKAKNSFGKNERDLKIIAGDRIALTPPLGWNSWNCFADAVDEKKVKAAADAMVNSGLINFGWTYINIDDFWENKPGSTDPDLIGPERHENGKIVVNKKFPDMKALGNYIHGKGLKMGIYSSPGPLTCGGCVASYKFEEQDAQSYSEWGIDYLKYDWCSYGEIAKDDSREALMKPYHVMRAALDKVNRDIVFSLCQYGMGKVWEWGDQVGGNCWRTTGDITDTWESMSSIGFSQVENGAYAKPGNWNDPDMLVVGMVGWGPQLHPSRLTPNEQYTHISLWSLLASPLLIGCDMTRFDDFTFGLLSNTEVLDVNQDPLGKQASRISKAGDLEVWAKDLEDGSKAVGLFNRGNKRTEVTAAFKELGLEGKYIVRDLWRQKDIGTFEDAYRAFVPSHGVVLVRIKKLSL